MRKLAELIWKTEVRNNCLIIIVIFDSNDRNIIILEMNLLRTKITKILSADFTHILNGQSTCIQKNPLKKVLAYSGAKLNCFLCFELLLVLKRAIIILKIGHNIGFNFGFIIVYLLDFQNSLSDTKMWR